VKTSGFLLSDEGEEQQTSEGTLLTFLENWKKRQKKKKRLIAENCKLKLPISIRTLQFTTGLTRANLSLRLHSPFPFRFSS
jgi:hypothetical protein